MQQGDFVVYSQGKLAVEVGNWSCDAVRWDVIFESGNGNLIDENTVERKSRLNPASEEGKTKGNVCWKKGSDKIICLRKRTVSASLKDSQPRSKQNDAKKRKNGKNGGDVMILVVAKVLLLSSLQKFTNDASRILR